jgi:hypothetical protein
MESEGSKENNRMEYPEFKELRSQESEFRIKPKKKFAAILASGS